MTGAVTGGTLPVLSRPKAVATATGMIEAWPALKSELSDWSRTCMGVSVATILKSSQL
jgi:hypothetical protein